MNTRRRIEFDRYAPEAPPIPVGGGLICEGMSEFMSNSFALSDVISLVKNDTTVYWVSNGDWSMHEMLMALLDITGPAHVAISSYAMSESPARIIALLKEKGSILSLISVLDNRIDVRTAGSFQLMKGISDKMVLVDTHAKVTVITNEDWNIAVVGSANYTENKRYEAGIISTNPLVVAMQLKWINKALSDGIQQ